MGSATGINPTGRRGEAPLVKRTDSSNGDFVSVTCIRCNICMNFVSARKLSVTRRIRTF